MDGQTDARSGNSSSDKRSENIHKKRPRDRNRGANNQRYKFLIRTRCIMVHLKSERQATTRKSHRKKSDGRIGSNNHHGYAQPSSNKGLNRLRMYGVMYQREFCEKTQSEHDKITKVNSSI